MSKSKKVSASRGLAAQEPMAASPRLTPRREPGPWAAVTASPAKSYAWRETIESIVIAFVLAFLFRTFEAEAFIIPTGSMAPTLMGRHKDVECPKCGYRYQVTASDEENERPEWRSDCIAGMCPMCHYVLPMRPDVPLGPNDRRDQIRPQSSYNGDRILVNKFIYTVGEPQRWDVVVFKYPGEAKVNYIKRLVGLPGETVRVYQGDLFLGGEGASKHEDFKISRKPPEKILAMRQLVHDTNHDPAELDAAGWPLRWHAPTADAKGWQLAKSIEGNNVRQTYSVDVARDREAWLRYEHIVPDFDVWQHIAEVQDQPADARSAPFSSMKRSEWPRRLITDANPYNARAIRRTSPDSLRVDRTRQGLHWVGDLMVEADIDVESASGELLLDLVEGGQHFRSTIDLATGDATLSAGKLANYAPKAHTSMHKPGKYHVAFANVDDQLLLWIDNDLVAFEGDTTYDADKLFGDRRRIRPEASETDLGDLAPAGIGARGTKLSVTRLQVWRDIYYIAVKADDQHQRIGNEITDFEGLGYQEMLAMPENPKLWDLFLNRPHVDFPLGKDQLFVMGDNSAESSDARIWRTSDPSKKPGGPYLERRLLIGKALCVYWPHSWNRIPGTPIPFPLFPNVADMRLVR
jgi:signal peptidase I